jgi:hypothetical protein
MLNPRAGMTADVAWMFEGLLLLDADAYQASPFPWAGSLQSIRWKGDLDHRTVALAAAKAGFSDLPWVPTWAAEWASAAAWPDDASVVYVQLLKSFYTFDAIRVLAGAYGLDGAGDINQVITRCLDSRIPLSSPDYLAAYANRVRKVSSGAAAGGARFAMTDDDRVPQLPRVPVLPPPAAPPVANAGNSGDAQRTLQDIMAASGGGPTVALIHQMLAMMQQQQALCTTLAQNQSGPRAEVLLSPPKAKTGWAKVVAETKAALIDGSVPPVLKLSRVNRERLIREQTSSTDTRKVLLGGVGGAELHLPGQNTDKTTKSGGNDDTTWSGLSAYFRLFSIMVCMTENEFPRAKMADFFAFWTELWDSPRGSRTQKIKASVTFYEKYTDELGSGTWKNRFDTDSRFLLEALSGESPALCKECGGSGDSRKGSTGDRSTSRPSDRNGGTKNKRDRPTRPPGYCLSMLDVAATCTATDCRFLHSPCPSCQGKCDSAAKCSAWDQKAITEKYGQLLQAARRGGSKSKRR